MHAPLTKNSVQKKRVVNAMLDERSLGEWSTPPPRQTSSSRPWSRSTSYLVIALALLCASAVFLLLYRHDNSVFLKAQAPQSRVALAAKPERSGAPPSVASAAQNADRASTGTSPSAPGAKELAASASPSPEPLQFKVKKSRVPQLVGSVSLRLVRLNPRRRTGDVSIAINGRRTVQRRFQMNRAIQIPAEQPSHQVQIIVSAMTKDSISGTLREADVDPPPSQP